MNKKASCDRLVFAHSANFVILTFVFLSHRTFLVEIFLHPLARCAGWQLLPSPMSPSVTQLEN